MNLKFVHTLVLMCFLECYLYSESTISKSFSNLLFFHVTDSFYFPKLIIFYLQNRQSWSHDRRHYFRPMEAFRL